MMQVVDMTFGTDIKLNYQLFYKLKLIGRGKFNHLIITLIDNVSKKKKKKTKNQLEQCPFQTTKKLSIFPTKLIKRQKGS
jgi:hypothetical protein